MVSLANANSPGQTVLSGELTALQRAMELAKARGARLVQRLQVSIAAHSPLMQNAAHSFSELVHRIHLRPPEVPLVANISARALTSVDELRHELSEQLTRPVQWTRSVQEMVAHGVDTIVEIGPRQVLTGLVKRITPDARPISMSDTEVARLVSEPPPERQDEQVGVP